RRRRDQTTPAIHRRPVATHFLLWRVSSVTTSSIFPSLSTAIANWTTDEHQQQPIFLSSNLLFRRRQPHIIDPFLERRVTIDGEGIYVSSLYWRNVGGYLMFLLFDGHAVLVLNCESMTSRLVAGGSPMSGRLREHEVVPDLRRFLISGLLFALFYVFFCEEMLGGVKLRLAAAG
ncbi:hypothetical protein KSS87_020084, partial [Heliosperma pusillum]